LWPQKWHLYLSFLITIFLPLTSASQTPEAGPLFNLNVRELPVKEVLRQLEEQSSYVFLFNSRFIDVNRKVSISVRNEKMEKILEQLFRGADIESKVIGNQIILSNKNTQESEKEQDQEENRQLMITGRVADAKSNLPLPGVIIRVQGTNIYSVTRNDGNFSLEVPHNRITLVFSFLGYESLLFTLDDQQQLDIRMEEKNTYIEEVIVTALGILRQEKALGYSVQKIEGESLQTVKMADMTTSLTGKISGLLIKNSTNFGTAPIIQLRGENPLIVIDGVPTDNVSINDVSPDDISNINVLKGATASALYGYRGAAGAIIITTLRGNRENGLTLSVNSSTMFNMGFLVVPKTQKSYSSGFNGVYGNDYVWGDKLDIGRTATLWDPYEKVWKENSPLVSKGVNNLKNFQELGYIMNHNISLSSRGENSSLRSSLTYVYNKGQFPNQKLNKFTYTLGGEMEFNKLKLESNISYSKHLSPNTRGSQYSGGYLYNLIGWLGAEYDVRDYKNYWLVKDQSQNWFNYEWYDNPYFLAYEVITSSDRDILNGNLSATYKFSEWASLSMRSGWDFFYNRYISRNPIGARNAFSYYGYFGDEKNSGYSINNDLILSLNKTIGNFTMEGILGGTLFFSKNDFFEANTEGGLSIPGFYSLKASKDPIGWETSLKRRQVNSLYGRATFSWKSLAYLDLTGRNDWSSTLSANHRSYFYPSVAGSFIVSELLPKTSWLDLWKLRSSWTVSKTPAGIYDIISAYNVNNEVWGGYNSANYPTQLRSQDVRPQTVQTTEYGTAAHFFGNRLRFDLTYYRMRIYDFLAMAPISDASGFTSSYVNTQEERSKKGIEAILGITPIESGDWKWSLNLNWSKDATYYDVLDEQYTPDEWWVYKGGRVDAYTVRDWERDSENNIIHINGLPVRSGYYSVVGNENPSWIAGLTSNLKYKNLTFAFSVDGRMGGYSFSRLDALLWHSGAHIKTDNQWRYDEVVNGLKNYIGPGVKVISGEVTYDSYGKITSDTRVFAPNDVEVSYESYTKNYYNGSWSWGRQDILDETFIKLREASLTYMFPRALGNKYKITDVTLSLVGQNLFFWGKEYKISDPDYGEAWDLVSPSMRYTGMNIKFNF
jgi:TonB-linked SusC/RagA family outer membrane protein